MVKLQGIGEGAPGRQGVPGEYILFGGPSPLSADNMYSIRQTRSKGGEQVVAIPMASPYVQMTSMFVQLG